MLTSEHGAPRRLVWLLCSTLALAIPIGCGDDGEAPADAKRDSRTEAVPPEFDPGPDAVEVAEGRAPNGTAWRLLVSNRSSDGLCIRLDLKGKGASGSCGVGVDRALIPGTGFDAGVGQYIHGTVSAKVTSVEAHLDDETNRRARIYRSPTSLRLPSGRRFFVLFTGSARTERITAMGASGEEVASLHIPESPAMPTGERR